MAVFECETFDELPIFHVRTGLTGPRFRSIPCSPSTTSHNAPYTSHNAPYCTWAVGILKTPGKSWNTYENLPPNKAYFHMKTVIYPSNVSQFDSKRMILYHTCLLMTEFGGKSGLLTRFSEVIFWESPRSK